MGMDENGGLSKFYKDGVNKFQPLTPEDEIELGRSITEGGVGASLAEKKLVEANLRLVIYLARQGYQKTGLPLNDLIQAGNEGLIKAATKFDPTRGCRFSTYARWLIIEAMQSCIREMRPISISSRGEEILYKARKIEGIAASQGHSAPTAQELAEMLGVPAERLLEVRLIDQATLSLDVPMGADGRSLNETLPDGSENPEVVMVREELRAQIMVCLEEAGLSDREKIVIQRRFLADQRSKLVEIGNEFGLSRERVRQIEREALKKIRAVLLKGGLR